MKVFGIGLNKTGTKSLAACLRYWGLTHVSLNQTAFRLWHEGDIASLAEIAAVYDSFEDWPWPLLYREFDARFPGSKFVLTRRKSPEIWFASLARHALETGPTEYRKHIYGSYMPQSDEAGHLAFYRRHNDDVRAHFAARPLDFVEVCWEEGHGWDELARFLGLPLPALPFPHVNRGGGL